MRHGRAETLGSSDGRRGAQADYAKQVRLRVDSAAVALPKEVSAALAALSVLACNFDWDGGKEAKVVQARQAQDQLRKPKELMKKVLHGKLKKAAPEPKKAVIKAYDDFSAEVEDAESVRQIRATAARHRAAFEQVVAPGVLRPQDVFTGFEEQVDVCEKQVAGDGHGLGGLPEREGRRVRG